MKKFFAKKYFPIVSTALFLFVEMTQFTNAAPTSAGVAASIGNAVASGVGVVFANIGYVVIGKIAFVISYLAAWIGGICISIESWLIGAMLGINTGVFQSQIVQKGFGVTLSIANLGFVLGIIIIAIATILRRETYGYKSILWKLVAAAILVNFSLVIAAPIFNLGNSFTTYFLNCIDPSGGGCSGQDNGISSMNNFALNLTSAFNPQDGLLVGSISGNNAALNENSSIALGQGFSQMLIPIISVLFVAFELISIAIVLGALIVMLLIRYLYIAILAILMPFAWLGWVFPNIKSWWSNWWSNFIRWTFFAPIVLFFLWLAMATENAMRNGGTIASQNFGTYTSASNPAWAYISQFFTAAFSPIIQQVLNTLLMIGLSVAGLIVADRMSITGAKGAIGAVQSVGKGVGNFANKQRKKATRAVAQKIDKRFDLTNRLREGRIGPARIIPFARRAASYAGEGIENVKKAGGEHLVDEEAAWAKKTAKDPKVGQSALAGDLNTQKQIALIKALAENQDLDNPGQKVNGVRLSEYIAKNKQLFKDYGQYKPYDKDLRKTTVNEQASAEAKAVADGTPDKEVHDEDGKVVKALDGLRSSMKEFVSKLKTSDVPKMDSNGVFHEDYLKDDANKERIKMFLQKTAAYNFQLVPAILRTMKGKQQATFRKMYEESIEKERQYQKSLTPTTPEATEDRDMAVKNLDLAKTSFNKIIENLARGSGSSSGSGQSAAPAGPVDTGGQ